MSLCEPPRKKARTSTASTLNQISDYCARQYDRVLVVGKKKFQVNSEVLASKSDYFRILFNSNFMEKEQEEIELKEICAKRFKQFLIVVKNPGKFEATREKLIFFIKTVSYFNAPSLLKDLLTVNDNINKISKTELLALARCHGIKELTEIVEDWYLEQSDDIDVKLKYKQYKRAVKYDLKRLMNCLEDYLVNASEHELDTVMQMIFSNKTKLRSKMIDRMKAHVLLACKTPGGNINLLHILTSRMDDSEFESIQNDIESLLLYHYKKKRHIGSDFGWDIPPRHFQKLNKLKAFVTDKLIEEFPDYYNHFEMLQIGIHMKLERFMEFVNDYFISDFPESEDLHHIYVAMVTDENHLEKFKNFVKVYLQNNFATLREVTKSQITNCRWENVKQFVLEAILVKYT